MEENKTADKAANTNMIIRYARAAGELAWDLATRAWRVEAVKSVALTWLVRASVPGAAIIVSILDSYLVGHNG